MIHKPEADCGIHLFGLRKRVRFAAAICLLFFLFLQMDANRTQAHPIEYELHTLTLADQNGNAIPDFQFSTNTRTYDIDVSGSVTRLTIAAEAENEHSVSIYPSNPVPLLWGSNRITIGVGEGDTPYTLTVHRGAKSPDLHLEEHFAEFEMSQNISTVKPTEDGGLIALGTRYGTSQLYKMNGQGEVTAKSTLLNIKLNDVLEIKKNRYLVVGTRADTPGGTHRPFVAVYEAIPGAGPAGFFQPLTALSPGLGDEKSDPVSIVRMESADEYIIAVNRNINSAWAIQLYRLKINADPVLQILSQTTISGADSYFANKIVKVGGSDHYLVVGYARDRVTQANHGLLAKVHYNADADTLSPVNDFGTDGLVKSGLAPMAYVSAAQAGEDRYVILGTRESFPPHVGNAELHVVKEDGSYADEARLLPDLWVPNGNGALAAAPDGGFVVGGIAISSGNPDVHKGYVYKFGTSLEEHWKQTMGGPGHIIGVSALLPLVNGDIWVSGGFFKNWGDLHRKGYIANVLGPAALNRIEPADLTYVAANESGAGQGYLDDTHLTWNVPGNVNRIQGTVDRKPGQTVRVNGKLLPENEPFHIFLPEVNNTAKIEVTAADQLTKKLYTLDIIKTLPYQATVTGVTYNGTPLIPYEHLQTFYMPVTSSVYQANLDVVLSDPSATFDLFPSEGVTRDMNRIHIDSLPYGQQYSLALTVHSVEHIPSRWTIRIGPPSNDAELKHLYAQSPSAVVERAPDRFIVTVPNEMSHVTLDPIISDYASIVQVTGARFDPTTQSIEVSFLQEGSNPVTVVVQAQSGMTQTFGIDVIRDQRREVGAIVPSLQPAGNMWFEVTLSTLPADAAIYYTVDGTDPTLSSALYDPENKPRLFPGQTLKAIGVKWGLRNSPVLVLTGPDLEYPGLRDISDILSKINDRADVYGGGFGTRDVEYWLSKIKPVKVVPVPPPAG
ncbi:cadherin-like beta sandwich domain-containing protein [Paenibacillus sp. JMULE4]|uniref:cadherin-like beta sandwich domain-containing protein n=1 Tax=Paenibacillus TaxID=44249 RepID=UPI0020C63FA4|nr:cadherin-like beta sandwich domain-containing protein [Paenibacillus sp. JMULE4]